MTSKDSQDRELILRAAPGGFLIESRWRCNGEWKRLSRFFVHTWPRIALERVSGRADYRIRVRVPS